MPIQITKHNSVKTVIKINGMNFLQLCILELEAGMGQMESSA